jgi:hypothetical protein
VGVPVYAGELGKHEAHRTIDGGKQFPRGAAVERLIAIRVVRNAADEPPGICAGSRLGEAAGNHRGCWAFRHQLEDRLDLRCDVVVEHARLVTAVAPHAARSFHQRPP